VRILVTNDDGIDSVGLHVLALGMRPFGDVVVAAPDIEYSGAGCAVGALQFLRPEVHRVQLEQLDGMADVWTVSGPPALCVMFARLGAFGTTPFDLVVSGINPGANVGRAVYHSGTVGAAITARNAGITGLAVSQDVTVGSVEGQAWDEMLLGQRWETAAHVAGVAVEALIDDLPAEGACLNINVPNLPVEQLKGWRKTSLALTPTRSMAPIELEPKIGHKEAFRVNMSWGTPIAQPIESDAGAVQAGYVSMTWLSRITPVDVEHPGLEKAFDGLAG
jgi:5'-nucleotidase